MELENLKLEVADLVATVTLDRPPVNALGRAIREEMICVFDAPHDRVDGAPSCSPAAEPYSVPAPISRNARR
jgi:hypothetical protein